MNYTEQYLHSYLFKILNNESAHTLTICNKQCFHRKMVILTFFTLKDLSLIMNLTKFFAWKYIKTCLRGKIEGLNKEADYY